MGFILRLGFAFLLVAGTFNPTRFNYVHWATNNYKTETPLAVLLGLLLFIAYVVYLRATLRSIGGFGMFLVLAVLAALIWVLYDRNIVTLQNRDLNTWIGIVSISAVLGVGLTWSFVRRALSGQADMDDVDD